MSAIQSHQEERRATSRVKLNKNENFFIITVIQKHGGRDILAAANNISFLHITYVKKPEISSTANKFNKLLCGCKKKSTYFFIKKSITY